MDEGPDAISHRSSAGFGPDRRWALLAIGAAIVFAGLTLATDDAGGKLLYALATVVCLAIGGDDLIVTPRLVVDEDGLRLRSGSSLSWKTLRWAEVQGFTVDQQVRHGLTSATLEIDDGTNLILLGRHALGRDPREVADLVGAFAPDRG